MYVELAWITPEPLHDTKQAVVLPDDGDIEQRPGLEFGHMNRCGQEQVVGAAIVQIRHVLGFGATARPALADLQLRRRPVRRHDHFQDTGVPIEQPQDTVFGNDRDLADLDDLAQ